MTLTESNLSSLNEITHTQGKTTLVTYPIYPIGKILLCLRNKLYLRYIVRIVIKKYNLHVLNHKYKKHLF